MITGEHHDEGEERRHAAGGEESPEAQVADLTDRDVLGIADQRGGGAGIGGGGERQHEGARVEPAPAHAGDQQRRHAEEQDVVRKDRRESAAHRDGEGQQGRGPAADRHQPLNAKIQETPTPRIAPR